MEIVNKKLSYQTCKDIYRETVMGKRVVEGLINFALSVDREITIQAAPQEVVDEFIKVSNEMKQTEKIKQTLYNSRIFGTGGLLVNCLKKEMKESGDFQYKPDFTLKPTFQTIKDFELYFVVLDTLNLSNAKIDTDILSPTFLQLIDINVNSYKIDNRFIAISHAIDCLYQDDRTDNIAYAPPSVFYNMTDLLKDYDRAIEGLDALLYKSGCFIYQFPSKSKISGATYDAIKTSNYILEQKSNGSVISIQKDADIKDFPLSNINGLIEAVNKLEDAITKALNDTPASILFDRQLSNGFSNGDKDKETEIQIVNTFRQNKIKPLYDLTDYYVMLRAWTDDFIDEIKEKYTNLKKYSNIQLFKKWQDDFVFEFGNLYPEPENITIENNAKKLDNLLKLQQLGANISDIEAELNEDRIFKNDIDLDGQPQQFEDGDENTNIDYNLYKSIFGKNKKLSRYIDSNFNVMADEEPPAGHEWKTLENGEHVLINSESGEIVSGAGIENWKGTGKMTVPKVNAEAEKNKEPKKKITKNYSISYDNETIEKLNKLGKNWKDKRIYFKDLNNSYYDLENEKWVCDKPETTEKALMIAGENEAERGARLEAEKQEREAKERAEYEAKEKAKEERKEYLVEYNKKTMNRIYNEDDNYISNKFYKEVGKAMYEAGIFEEGYIPTGSINKIKSKLFTDEEIKNWDELYENSINDIVYAAVKTELNHVQNMYKPMSWGDWLWSEKNLNNGSQSVNDIEDLTDEDPDLIREELNFRYINNKVAWEKYGEEFNQYKENYKKEAKEKIKEYIKKNYVEDTNNKDNKNNKKNSEPKKSNNTKITITNKSKDGLDKLEGKANDYLKGNANKLKEEVKEETKSDAKIDSSDIDYKTDAEIDNDIEYYIDNLIEYIDAKKKDFDESKVKRDADGKFATKNSNGNKDNSSNGGNSKITAEEQNLIKAKKEKIEYYINFEEKELKENKYLTDDLKENLKAKIETFKKHLKELDTNPNGYLNYSRTVKENEAKIKDPKTITQRINNLPKSLQGTAKISYNNLENSEVLNNNGNLDEEKYNALSNTEKAIYQYTNSETHRGTKKQQSNIIKLIRNSPYKSGLMRGEKDDYTGELSIGSEIGFGETFRSFANSDRALDIALNFAGKNKRRIFRVIEPVNALNVKPYSDYHNKEDEYLCYGKFEVVGLSKGIDLAGEYDIIDIKPKERN